MITISHRKFNNYLTALVIFVAVYIIIAPLMPEISWWVRESTPLSSVASHTSEVVVEDNQSQFDYELLMPSIGLDDEIDLHGVAGLSNGVAHQPFTGNPVDGGNTVLIGHRFTYDDAGVFYHLDKVNEGDNIVVYWDKARFDYKVTEVFEVSPDEVSIEAPTDEPTLTLYTCTPLWTSKNRLVIRALPVNTGAEQ